MTFEIQTPVVWRGPVPNESGGFVRPAHGCVVHIMDGSLVGTDGWFHNPKAQASSDYGVGKNGPTYQWVDWTTNWKAWAEAAGNPFWVSIENEGRSGELLTPYQVDVNAQIVAHVFTMDGVPFRITHDINGRGLIAHGDGGAAWGGHPNCPGTPIRSQFQQILDRASTLADIHAPGPVPPPITLPAPVGDEMLAFVMATDPESGGSWKVRIFDGAMYADDGAPYLGGLNTHLDWHAGDYESNNQHHVEGITAWKDPAGRWGYCIWVYFEEDKLLHPFRFPRDGSQK